MSKDKIERNGITVEWSEVDGEYVALHKGFPSLSWLESDPEAAYEGILALLEEVEADSDD